MPAARGHDGLRIQLVIEGNVGLQHLRYRAACFRFLDDLIERRRRHVRQDDLALQRDIGNRKAAVGFIEGDHCGSVDGRCGISSSLSISDRAIEKQAACSADQLSGLVPFTPQNGC